MHFWKHVDPVVYDHVAAAQVALNVITLAFLVVAGTCAVLIPVMLYVFWLKPQGWQWYDAALFGSMIASTDAVAIVAVLKKSAPLAPSAPECLQSVHAALPGDVLLLFHRFNSSFQLKVSIQAQLDATGGPVKVKMTTSCMWNVVVGDVLPAASGSSLGYWESALLITPM